MRNKWQDAETFAEDMGSSFLSDLQACKDKRECMEQCNIYQTLALGHILNTLLELKEQLK